jgi:hypothetical protein
MKLNEISNSVWSFFHFLNLEIFYQQSGDAKTLYFAPYSADVSEDAPVIKS